MVSWRRTEDSSRTHWTVIVLSRRLSGILWWKESFHIDNTALTHLERTTTVSISHKFILGLWRIIPASHTGNSICENLVFALEIPEDLFQLGPIIICFSLTFRLDDEEFTCCLMSLSAWSSLFYTSDETRKNAHAQGWYFIIGNNKSEMVLRTNTVHSSSWWLSWASDRLVRDFWSRNFITSGR